MEQETINLKWPEYLVFFVVLLISLVIGIYYAIQGRKRNTTAEYLLASRSMSAFPFSASLICTTISAITILATPVETYLYGTQAMCYILAYIPLSLSLYYLYLPVYFRLQVNSAYEYIELRFNGTVRAVVSLISIAQLVVSMAIAVYAPSLAINQVTGISPRISTAIIYLVCVFYSALGGLKAVLWTDFFQVFVMLGSVIATVIIGMGDVGGWSNIWQKAWENDRIEFFNFDFDSRTRHTIWTETVGAYFFLLPAHAASQIQIQRFLSMPNIREVNNSLTPPGSYNALNESAENKINEIIHQIQSPQLSLILNALGLAIILTLCYFFGIVIFAAYADCDPITTKVIAKSYQLVPYFVMNSVRDIPCLIGLFLSGITVASMSSLSSGLSALTSILTYDYIGKFYPKLPDWKLSLLSKINCLLFGLVSYAFVFVVENMGDILPATSAILGVFAGPILGLFTLGMFFPFANSKGSLSGMVIAVILMLTFVIGNQIASNQRLLPDQRLPLSTDGCISSNVSSAMIPDMWPSTKDRGDWKNQDDSFLIQLLSVSYLWYTAMGVVLAMIFGLLMSWAFRTLGRINECERVKREHLSPSVVWVWEKLFPNLLTDDSSSGEK